MVIAQNYLNPKNGGLEDDNKVKSTIPLPRAWKTHPPQGSKRQPASIVNMNEIQWFYLSGCNFFYISASLFLLDSNSISNRIFKGEVAWPPYPLLFDWWFPAPPSHCSRWLWRTDWERASMLSPPTTRSASILLTELGIPWEETHMQRIRLSNALFRERPAWQNLLYWMWCLKLLIDPSHCCKWLFVSCPRIHETSPDHVFVCKMWAWSLHADFKNWISSMPHAPSLIGNVEHIEQIHDLMFLDAQILLDKSTCHCCEMCVSCTETFAKNLL